MALLMELMEVGSFHNMINIDRHYLLKLKLEITFNSLSGFFKNLNLISSIFCGDISILFWV